MVSPGPVKRLPKGFNHLISNTPNKFADKTPSRFPHATRKFVQPQDRIRKWNIRPGDKVRLMIGKAKEKYRNEVSAEEGYKVHTVKSVDLERNRVFLDGVQNIKTQPMQPLPEGFDQMKDDEKQAYKDQKNFTTTMRPVHYSNVQLCIEDRESAQSIFATRLKTGGVRYNPATHRIDWRRYAARITGDGEADAEHGQISIDWPRPSADSEWKFPAPDATYDTINASAMESSLSLAPATFLAKHPLSASLFPQHILAPPPTNQSFSNHYISPPPDTKKNDLALLDTLMPLYLSEELAPRFAKRRTFRAWKARREAEEIEKDAEGKKAVREWTLAGRDKGLEKVLEDEAIGLEGVHLRPRTSSEVDFAAKALFDTLNAESTDSVGAYSRAGYTFDHATQTWEASNITREAERKKMRKAKKVIRLEKKMENLKLVQGKNMVVPEEIRLHKE